MSGKMMNIAKATKYPARSLVEKLAMLKKNPALVLPTKVTVEENAGTNKHGRQTWRRAFFSRRQQADIKKQAAIAGLPYPIEGKPEAEPGKSFHEIRIFRSKGHKHERNKPAFLANIAAKMAEMPKLIAEWREAKAKMRVKTPMQKLMWMPSRAKR
mmetsp:Transcript_56369/g.133841  ORF Transcript_56369/g.133841 Transcript_56369/m.133841 type:complete len:156 (-) Transcript_56369:295-762(-)